MILTLGRLPLRLYPASPSHCFIYIWPLLWPKAPACIFCKCVSVHGQFWASPLKLRWKSDSCNSCETGIFRTCLSGLEENLIIVPEKLSIRGTRRVLCRDLLIFLTHTTSKKVTPFVSFQMMPALYFLFNLASPFKFKIMIINLF